MSAQDFKPGDVAMVSTPGLSGRRATWATTCPKENHPATPHWHIADRNTYLPASAHGLRVRPLATIDPDADDDLSRLWRLLPDNLVSIDQLQAALREFANPTPPKPDEPTGLGAVVRDSTGRHFVRFRPDGGPAKWALATVEPVEIAHVWSAIDAVEVLSPGWSE